MNTAARAQSAAEAGGILVTKAVYDRARRRIWEGESTLKAFEKPIELYASEPRLLSQPLMPFASWMRKCPLVVFSTGHGGGKRPLRHR